MPMNTVHIEQRTLRAITLTALLGLLIVWGLAGGLMQYSRQVMLNSAKTDLTRVIGNTETALNRQLVSLDALLAETATWALDLHDGAAPAAQTALDRQLMAALSQNLMLRDVAIIGPHNHVLAAARPETKRLGLPAAGNFLEQVRLQAYPSLLISEPLTSDLYPERVIHLARSTRLTNGTVVAVVASVRVALLSTELDSRDPSGATTVTLESTDGRLLAAYPDQNTHASHNLHPALPDLHADGQSIESRGRFTTEATLLTARPLVYAGLWVSASQPVERALSDWETERTRVAVTASVLSLMLLAVALGGRRYVQRMAAARYEVTLANADLNTTNQALQHSITLVQATLDATADAIVVVNQSGQVIQFNDRYLHLIGMTQPQLMGCEVTTLSQQLYSLLLNPEEARQVGEQIQNFPDTDTRDELRLRDGRVFLRHSTPQRINGLPVGRVWSHQDITDFRRAEHTLLAQQAELQLARNELAATLEALPDLLFELDETGLYLNAHCHSPEKMVVSPSIFLDKRVHEVVPAKAADQVMACLHEAKQDGSSYGRQIALTIRQQEMWFELSAARKQTPEGVPTRFVVVARDISERKANERLIWNQAHFDYLTGLPNRRMFRHKLNEALQEVRSDTTARRQLVIMFVDLDRFKEVNDTHGHDVGDLLLQEAAVRLKSCVRDTDLVARLGGDEFTLVIEGMEAAQHAAQIAQKLLDRMTEPFYLAGETEHISASIGVTVFPDDGRERDELIQQADQAMYAAKRAGRNRWERFSPAMQEAALVRARIARDLRTALPEGQFQVVYQPITNLQTGLVQKAEALLRWHHPLHGPIAPDVFIPIAEETGLINDIGRWVFETAARQAQRWRQTLHPEFQISINQSPAQFREDSPQGETWTDFLTKLDLPGSSVVFEITEGLLVDASASTRNYLKHLHAAGIQISLDDFGTGYSALSYLHEFDLDYLKIDRAFVQHMETSAKDWALCKATILMAHELGLRVVAEGVETPGQQHLLAQAGCDFGQGHLFSPPVDAASFESWLWQRQNSVPAHRAQRITDHLAAPIQEA